MLTCKGCSRSLIRAFLSISTEQYGTLSRSRNPTILHANTRRSAFATSSRCFKRKRSPEEQARIDAGLPTDIQTYEEAGIAVLKGSTAITRFHGKPSGNDYRYEETNNFSMLDGKTPILATKLSREARLELEYIEEPYRLAERCLAILKKGEFDLAVFLVQHAGRKGMQTTVAWNHILNTASKAGFLDSAYKLYNDMKKRDQKPDAYTFSVLLRGYVARSPLSQSDVQRAYKIYESLYLPNSFVKPSIIHSNIMLEICARAGALDILFQVGSRLPANGPNSPDQITYTSIFNALSNTKIPSEDEHEAALERISQARRVWDEVLEKWKSGSLLLGEELLCAMGRCLLISPLKEDWMDVFRLVEEFMGIPQQHIEADRPMYEPGSHNIETASEISSPSDLAPTEDSNIQDASTSATPEAQPTVNPEPALALFPHDTKSVRAAGLILPKPGPKTLSLVLAACAKTKRYKISMKYWDILRKQFQPDRHNFTEIMRQAKISVNSSFATIVLRDVYQWSRDPKSIIQFHPALWEHGMTACYRTQNAQIALRDATRILVMLQMSEVEPSFSVIELFIKILSKAKAGYPIQDIIRAQESLMLAFGNLRSLYSFGRMESIELPPASETLRAVNTDIDSKWRPRVPQKNFELSKAQTDMWTEASSKVSSDERARMRRLGREIEVTFSKLLDMYREAMTDKQTLRIRQDLYRVRSWLFPRSHGAYGLSNDSRVYIEKAP